MKTATARARITPDIKIEAERILHNLGLTVSGAFEMFYGSSGKPVGRIRKFDAVFVV